MHTAPLPVVEPKRFGQYFLISEIARGTYGRLWTACRRLDSGETEAVLLRRLQKRAPLDDDALDEIRRAIELRTPLGDRRIARLLSVEETDDELGIVFEYAEGKDLKSILGIAPLKHMKMPPPVALHVIASALEGLVTLQRELPEELATPALWPDCVFVAADGSTHLLDPAVSSAIARVVGPKKYPQLVGYSSPEEFGDDDDRNNSDVFRAGILLWEMLAAKRLFTGGTTNTTVEQVQHAPIPALDDLTETYPGLVEMMNRALAHDRAERFASVEELLTAFWDTGVQRASDADVAAFMTELVGTGLAAQARAVTIALERVAQIEEKEGSSPTAAGALGSPPLAKVATKTVVSEVAPVPTRSETLLGVPAPAILGPRPGPPPPPPPPKRPPQPVVAGVVVAGTAPLDLTPIDDLESPLPSHPKTARTENSGLALLDTLDASDIDPVSGPAEALSESDLLVADEAPPAAAVMDAPELANELDSIAPPREPRFKRKHVMAAAAALGILLLSVGVLAVMGRSPKSEEAEPATTSSELAQVATETASAPAPATVQAPTPSASVAAPPVESASPAEVDAGKEAPVAALAPKKPAAKKPFVYGKPKVKPKTKTTAKSKTLSKPKTKTGSKTLKKTTKKTATKKPVSGKKTATKKK